MKTWHLDSRYMYLFVILASISVLVFNFKNGFKLTRKRKIRIGIMFWIILMMMYANARYSALAALFLMSVLVFMACYYRIIKNTYLK